MPDIQLQTFDLLTSGKLQGTRHLKLSAELKTFPFEIFDLADTLEILDLSGNHLSTLPQEFTRLKKLKILFLSDNAFTEFPAILGQCHNLDIIGFKANKIDRIAEHALPPFIRWLILTNNQLTKLPDSIGNCHNMQKLMLAGNRLTELPGSLINCKKLELLRISANQFSVVPSWLFSFPRLSWLALAGNPVHNKMTIQNNLNEISWDDLNVMQLLGEGASGMISKAQWQRGGQERAVAVKVFKGEVTSDGLPLDEMNACMIAGSHSNLIQVIGKIADHPQQKQGLAFELIDPTYKNLGGPPDFKTCTRDTFKSDTIFSQAEIVSIISGIVSVMHHLHDRGITHGDLYAHNILIDEDANPLLSDFGAAWTYDRKSTYGQAIERMEVRAFGCLLDDLLTRIDEGERSSSVAATLMQLQHACMQDDILLRPNFTEIQHRIKKLTIDQ